MKFNYNDMRSSCGLKKNQLDFFYYLSLTELNLLNNNPNISSNMIQDHFKIDHSKMRFFNNDANRILFQQNILFYDQPLRSEITFYFNNQEFTHFIFNLFILEKSSLFIGHLFNLIIPYNALSCIRTNFNDTADKGYIFSLYTKLPSSDNQFDHFHLDFHLDFHLNPHHELVKKSGKLFYKSSEILKIKNIFEPVNESLFNLYDSTIIADYMSFIYHLYRLKEKFDPYYIDYVSIDFFSIDIINDLDTIFNDLIISNKRDSFLSYLNLLNMLDI